MQWLLPAENPSGAIIGLIVIGALLAAESGLHESYLDTLLSAAITALVYWLAHSYAELLGERVHTREPITPRALSRALGRDVVLVRGASVPLLALSGAAIAGASQETAVNVGIWSVVACLVGFELVAGLRSGSTRGEVVLQCVVGATLGLAIIALKAILH